MSKSKLGTCVCLEDVLIALTDSCAEAIPFVLLPFVTTCYGLSAVVGCIWQIPPFFFFFALQCLNKACYEQILSWVLSVRLEDVPIALTNPCAGTFAFFSCLLLLPVRSRPFAGVIV